jgi:serine/threonine protein kinase
MAVQLLVTQGPDKGRTFQLNPGKTVQLGRSPATTTKLTDPAVSRVHCEIEVDDEKAVLHNISDRGTLVNGKPVTEYVLQVGDVIKMGETEIACVEEKPLTAGVAGDKPQDLTRLVGRRLEEYAVQSIIARGVNGVVFKAEDLTQNQRLVALKVFPAEFGENDEDVDRFIRAMKTMIPVRHQHLIAIHGAGKSGPFCWIAMEYFEGDSLTKVLEHQVGKPLDWKDAYRVAVHVAKALEYAQEHAIVHRNVTPANILFRARDRIAKLGDLMLAKALEGNMAKQITRQGRVVGDTAFVSPEATRGANQVTPKSDLYGLGATLYNLVTGRPPFAAKSYVDLMEQIRTATPEPAKKFQPAMPDAFALLIMKLLAKNPDERPAVKQVVHELENIGSAGGVSAYF